MMLRSIKCTNRYIKEVVRYAAASFVYGITILFVYSSAVAHSPSPRSVPSAMADIQLSFSPVVAQASPAVVNIYTSRKVQMQRNASPFMNDPFFQQFFNRQLPQRTFERELQSLGSGVIVDPSGLVVTSHHVVKDADTVKVVLNDGSEYQASVSVTDPSSDLALLTMQHVKKPLPHLIFATTDDIAVGDIVLAIGNPFGVGQTVTSGIVSGLARSAEGVSDYDFFIQTDAAINPGNSGGALVNMHAELVGINTAIYSKSGGSNGIGFAIPAAMVTALLTSDGESTTVQRSWLGTDYENVTAEMQSSLGLSSAGGVIISTLYDNTPAKHAGLRVGDVLVKFNDSPIRNASDLRYKLSTTPPDTKISITYIRQGKTHTATAQLSARPDIKNQTRFILQQKHLLKNVAVTSITQYHARQLGSLSLAGAALVVDIGTIRMRSYVRNGDIITHCNGTAITSPSQLDTLLAASPMLHLRFVRNGRVMQLRIMP